MNTNETKKAYRSAITRPSDDVIVVGTSMKGAYPMYLTHTCGADADGKQTDQGCGRKLIVLSTLPQAAARKFNRCGVCFEAARTAQFREKLKTQFDALPPELQKAWEENSAIAAQQRAERTVTR